MKLTEVKELNLDHIKRLVTEIENEVNSREADDKFFWSHIRNLTYASTELQRTLDVIREVPVGPPNDDLLR